MATAASAQVHRCKDAAGKTIFSDAPCSVGQTGELVQRGRTREEILEERLRISEEYERQSRNRAERAERSNYDRETQERMEYVRQRNNIPDKSTSNACKSAKKELEFVSSIQTLSYEAKRARMNAASTNVDVSCR